MATAWMANDWPRSTCTHCTPFLNSTASSSSGCFLPSVIWLNSPRNGGTLLLTGLPAATFTRPAGTWSGGGGLSEGGSMFGPAGRSSGVPLRVWLGSFSFSGSVGLASSARTDDATQASTSATARKDLGKKNFIRRKPRVSFRYSWNRWKGRIFLPLTPSLSPREKVRVTGNGIPTVTQVRTSQDSSRHLPALAVHALHKLRRLGRVGGSHVGPVPFQLVAHAGSQGDAPQQDDLGEVGGDVEVRVSRRAALHHREPFLVVAGRARDCLRHRLAGLVGVAALVFRFIVENDLEARAIIVPGKQFAFFADDEASAGREFAPLGDNLLGQVRAGPQGRDEVSGFEHFVL